MKNAKTPITGMVETDNKTYSFYLNDYVLTFMDTLVNSNVVSTIKPIDGLCRAMSHNGHKILFYIGNNDHPVLNGMRVSISTYIVSTANVLDYDISFYDGITFVGGTLGALKRVCGYCSRNKNGNLHIERNDDKQRFSFSTDEFNCDVEIGECIVSGGNSIINGQIYFTIMFDKPQKTFSFYRHYSKIKELISFLTNRQNVGFDEIYLLRKDILVAKKKITDKVARVFIQQDYKLTEKHIFENLEFQRMGNALSKLMEILYNTKDKKPSYSLGFYPENDENATLMTESKVRSICSALECEIGFIDTIKNDEDKKIKELIKQFKPIIKAHKCSNDKLKDKTYSLIESSMNNWSMAASDQIKELYHMYEEEMKLANKLDIKVGDEEIDALIKYRNHVTHGSYRVLDSTIAYTGHVLSCLVYCCVLTRIGISREDIKTWFHDGRLLN